MTGNECFYLNVNKSCPLDIATQDIGIRSVAECNHSRISSAAKFTCYKELTRIASCDFFFSHRVT